MRSPLSVDESLSLAHARHGTGLAQIVARPTFNQSLKGILSAGPVKSLRYVIPKLKKKWGKATSPSLPAPAPSSEVKKE